MQWCFGPSYLGNLEPSCSTRQSELLYGKCCDNRSTITACWRILFCQFWQNISIVLYHLYKHQEKLKFSSLPHTHLHRETLLQAWCLCMFRESECTLNVNTQYPGTTFESFHHFGSRYIKYQLWKQFANIHLAANFALGHMQLKVMPVFSVELAKTILAYLFTCMLSLWCWRS